MIAIPMDVDMNVDTIVDRRGEAISKGAERASVNAAANTMVADFAVGVANRLHPRTDQTAGGIKSASRSCSTRNTDFARHAGTLVLFLKLTSQQSAVVCEEVFVFMKRTIAGGVVLLLGGVMALAQQGNSSDEGARVQALDNSWNSALETKDTKALDLILADTFVSVDIDGSIETKSEFLSSIKAPDYHPSQAVTEQSTVHVYGDSAVVVGVFRTKGLEKRKTYVHRERFVDTWVKINGRWSCVAAITVLIPAK
jgi:ketosteroid isomerase-like protein